MATVTGPAAETRDVQLPDIRTWVIDLTAADVGVSLVLLDLRYFDCLELQFIGTLPAGQINLRGGLTSDPSTLRSDRIRLVTYGTGAFGAVVSAEGEIYGASREMAETNLPPYVQLYPNAAWTGVGKLYIRASRMRAS